MGCWAPMPTQAAPNKILKKLRNKKHKKLSRFLRRPEGVLYSAGFFVFFVWVFCRPPGGLGTKVPGASCAIHSQKSALGTKVPGKSAGRKKPPQKTSKKLGDAKHLRFFVLYPWVFCFLFSGFLSFLLGRGLCGHRGLTGYSK